MTRIYVLIGLLFAFDMVLFCWFLMMWKMVVNLSKTVIELRVRIATQK